MTLYGRNVAMEQYGSDPSMDPNSHSAETGLEEPMWHMGLGSRELYPERPGEPDCVYYIRTGFCGYGARCRFNHPRDRSRVERAARPGEGEYPERAGQPECQYFLKTGICKFGASCKYHHPRHGGGSGSSVSLNYYGYPLRPGEKECSYYMKTGQCKFGATCKFHHPQSAGESVTAPAPVFYSMVQSPSVPSTQQYGVVASSWQVARPSLLPGSYVQGTYPPMLLPSGMVSIPGWSPYLAPISPMASASTQPTVEGGRLYELTQLSPLSPSYAGPYPSFTSSASPSGSIQKEQIYPERPSQPECQNYMRTGECKFGSACRYHHPPRWISKTTYTLSSMGLPLRPGAPPCTSYVQYGACQFGSTCLYDHPMRALSYSPSASSLADMPSTPYSVGYSLATLAPSSSYSELRPVFNTDFKTRMPSENTSSDSVGSIFLKSGSVLSGRSSASSSGSGSGSSNNNTGHGT